MKSLSLTLFMITLIAFIVVLWFVYAISFISAKLVKLVKKPVKESDTCNITDDH